MKSKQVLSVEQMKHLKELGLDTSDGSMCWCYALSYKNAKWELEIYEDVIDQKRDSNFWETLPTYTLQDILDKLPHYLNPFPSKQILFAWMIEGENAFTDKSEALKKAEEMKIRKIASLRKQMEKLEKLSFKVEEI